MLQAYLKYGSFQNLGSYCEPQVLGLFPEGHLQKEPRVHRSSNPPPGVWGLRSPGRGLLNPRALEYASGCLGITPRVQILIFKEIGLYRPQNR